MPSHVPLSLLPPGVDAERFRPARPVDADAIRRRHGIAPGRPLVVCVSRLVPRKGQDVLIGAMPAILRREPDAALLVVGGGPDRERARGDGRGDAPSGSVAFAGEVADDDLPAYHAAADVFAMPCRSRLAGLEVEGFGIVFLEAAASGRPAVAGRSGGAAEAVVDQQTGLVVDGAGAQGGRAGDRAAAGEPRLAAAMGEAGRARVEAEFTWQRSAATLAGVLSRAAGAGLG